MHSVKPAIRAAVAALDSFGAISQREARTLLGYWARRDQLTDVDVETVLAHYASAPVADPDDLDDRHAMPPGGALPDGVEGCAVSGRAR